MLDLNYETILSQTWHLSNKKKTFTLQTNSLHANSNNFTLRYIPSPTMAPDAGQNPFLKALITSPEMLTGLFMENIKI